MPIYRDTDELYAVMKELWRRIKAHPEMGEKLLASRLVVRFVYREPDGVVTVDGRDGKEIHITVGASDIMADVEMSMKSDFAHSFWLGKENPAIALLQGKIVSRGPVNKALALLPVVRPAFHIYPSVVEDCRRSA